jgi:ankyrin repeat protein
MSNYVVINGRTYDYYYLELAALKGNLELVEKLISANMRCNMFIMFNATINGHLPVVKYLHSIGKRCNISAINKACRHGKYDVVEFYISDPTYANMINHDAMTDALLGGHLKIVKLLELHNGRINNMINIASSSGNLDLIKYLYNTGEDFTLDAITDTEINTYLASTGKQHISHILKYVIECNSDSISNYLSSIDITFNKHELNNASKNGCMQLTEYLYNIGIDCIKDVIDYAVNKEDGITIKYLYDKYKKCYTKSMYTAAENSNLEILQYLHNTVGVQYNTQVAIIAARKGHIDIIKLIDKRFIDHDVVCKAVEYGHVNIVEYLFTIGIDCSNTMDTAIMYYNMDMIDYLVSIGNNIPKCIAKLCKISNNTELSNYIEQMNCYMIV